MRQVLAWGFFGVSAFALLVLTACGDSSAGPSHATSPGAAPAAAAGAPGGAPTAKGEGAPPAAPLPTATPPAAPAAASTSSLPSASSAHADALGDPLPPGAIARLGSNRLRHQSAVVGLAFGPDGHSLVSAGTEGEVLVWEVPSGKLLRSFAAPREPTGGLSASRDLAVIALTRQEGDAQRLDGPSGLPSPSAPDQAPGNRAVVSPDGRWLARWGQPYTSVSIEPLGGGATRALFEIVEEYLDVAFDADGGRVALLGSQKDGPDTRTSHALLSVRDPASDEVLWRESIPGELLVSAAFSPDGQRLYAGDAHSGVHVFDASKGTPLGVWSLRTPDEEPVSVTSVAVSPDGERLAAAHGKSAVQLDTRSGAVLHELPGHSRLVNAVAYSPDGSLVATACADLIVRLFDAKDGQRVSVPLGHQSSIAHVLCAPDGRSICTVGSDGLCLLWPGDASGPPRELVRAPVGRVSAAYSPDSATLAICATEAAVNLYDVASATLRARWDTGVAGPAVLVAFAPDGSELATLHNDEELRLWPLAAGRPVATLPSLSTAPADGIASALNWLPDGRIAVGTSVVRLIDAKSGNSLAKIIGTSPIAEIACTPDGRLLATANADRTATLYELDPAAGSVKMLRSLGGHAGRVHTAAFSPDGILLATGGANESVVRLWDVGGGTEIERLAGHEGEVRTLAFTPDGHALISAGADAAALVWAMPPERAESPSR